MTFYTPSVGCVNCTKTFFSGEYSDGSFEVYCSAECRREYEVARAREETLRRLTTPLPSTDGEWFGREVGDVVRSHKDGRVVKLTGGGYFGSYGVSNHWYWREVMPDGTLGPEEHGRRHRHLTCQTGV